MTAYRYWRVQMQFSNYEAVVAEIELRATPGGTNLTGSGIASGSLYYTTSYLPSKAFDHDESDGSLWVMYWGTNADRSAWLEYDFGSPTTVQEAAIVNWSGSTFSAERAFVVASNDGETWHPVSVMTTTDQSPSAVSTIAIVDFTDTTLSIDGPVVQGDPAFTPTGDFAHILPSPALLDEQNGGGYQVTGEVDITGTPLIPVRRRVRLHDRRSGRLVQETWSDADTGAYAFTGLAPVPVYVLAIDHTDNYNAAIKDNLMPELMP